MANTSAVGGVRPGQSVGRYRIARRLAARPFGEEHLAVYRTAGGLLATCRLLLISRSLAGDHDETLGRLGPLLGLSHTGLTRMIDAGSADGHLYVAYEYQVGRDLASLVEAHRAERGPLDPGLATHVAAEVARGLAYALKQSRDPAARSHGQVGAASVFVADDGQVRLLWFGLPRVLVPELRALRPEAATEGDCRALLDLIRAVAFSGEESVPPPGERCVTKTERFEVMVARAEGRWQGSTRRDPIVLLPELELVQRKLGSSVTSSDLASLLAKLFPKDLKRESDELSVLLRATPAKAGPATVTQAPPTPVGAPSADEWEPVPGVVLANRYRIVRKIGEGGMGVVVEGEHLELGRRLAIKILRSYLSTDPEFAERFRREARAACRIGHRNIVDILDFGTTPDGRLYYVMEFLEGQSLEALLASEGPLEQPRALRIALQVCDALDAAHEAGVVHRDLKPDNIMLTREGHESEIVRVVDFGIAHDTTVQAKRLTQTGQIVGTPAYMAPEQVRSIPTDRRTDVYATGIILYEAVTGQLPFEAESAVEVMGAQVKDQPEPPREVAPGRDIHPLLERVILKAMEKAPELRHQTMADLAFELWEALEAIQEGPVVRPSGEYPVEEEFPSEVTSFTGIPGALIEALERSEAAKRAGETAEPGPEAQRQAAEAQAAKLAGGAEPRWEEETTDVEVDIEVDDAAFGAEPPEAAAPPPEALPEPAPAPPARRSAPSGGLGLDLDIDSLIADSLGGTAAGDEPPTTPFFDREVADAAIAAAEGATSAEFQMFAAADEGPPPGAAAEGGEGESSVLVSFPRPGGPADAAAPTAQAVAPQPAQALAAPSPPWQPEELPEELPRRRRATLLVVGLSLLVFLAAAGVTAWIYRDALLGGARSPGGGATLVVVDFPSADGGPAKTDAAAPPSPRDDLDLVSPRAGDAGASADGGDGGAADSAVPAGDAAPSGRADAAGGGAGAPEEALAEAREHSRKGRYGRAYHAWKALAKQYPDDAEVITEYGKTLLLRHKNGAAANVLKRAVELDPSNIETRIDLTRALARAGRRRHAREECREILRLDPENRTAQRLMKALRRR